MQKPVIVLIQTQAEGAGAQEIARILGQGLEARGFEVHQVFFFRRTSAFDHVPNAFFCADARPTSVRSLARMLLRLLGHLRRLRPDAALCFQHYGNLIGAPIARLAGIRHVVANQNSARDQMPGWVLAADKLLGASGLFSRVVVNSSSVEAEFARYPRSYRARVVRIDHGFEPKTSGLEQAAARAALALPPSAMLLGCAARLHPLKNLAAAIRLLQHDQRWHLALAGQGPERANLETLARKLGCADRVHFTGELSPKGVATFLRALDVFVFPSAGETFGLAVVEAAQAGVPVVANRLAVLQEVLSIDGQPCALFVDAADTAAFAAAVRRLFEEPALAAGLSARGCQLDRRYSLDAMVEAYVCLIEAQARHSAPLVSVPVRTLPSGTG